MNGYASFFVILAKIYKKNVKKKFYDGKFAVKSGHSVVMILMCKSAHSV